MKPRNDIPDKLQAQEKRVNNFIVKGGTIEDYRAQVKRLQYLEHLNLVNNKLGVNRCMLVAKRVRTVTQ